MTGSRLGSAARLSFVFALVAFLALAPPPAHATPPGANGKIAATTDRAVWTVNPDGTGMAQLTFPPPDDAYFDREPAWSSGGNRVAFARHCCAGEDTSADLYVINADGGGLTQLTFNGIGTYAAGPSWSPDGTKIAFGRGVGLSIDIYTINADGSGLTRLTNFGAHDPDWSPDGSKIAFTRYNPNPSGIGVMNADGSGATMLTSDLLDLQPSWSPDGGKIAFMRHINAGSGHEIYVMNADGSGQTNLTNDGPQDDNDPVWSPDGKKIAWQKIDISNPSQIGVWIMNADGTAQTPLHFRAGQPAWQPLPGPHRSEFPNAAHFCKAERAFMGESAFRLRYGNVQGANAFGKCVRADDG